MKTSLYLFVFSALLFCIACGSSPDRAFSKDKKMIQNEVVKYLKARIDNPRSYKAIDWEIIPRNDESGMAEKYLIRHEYKAKDGIGTVRNEADCFIYTKSDGNLYKDESCSVYKELYKKVVEDF